MLCSQYISPHPSELRINHSLKWVWSIYVSKLCTSFSTKRHPPPHIYFALVLSLKYSFPHIHTIWKLWQPSPIKLFRDGSKIIWNTMNKVYNIIQLNVNRYSVIYPQKVKLVFTPWLLKNYKTRRKINCIYLEINKDNFLFLIKICEILLKWNP